MNKKVLCIFAIICAVMFGFISYSCTDKDLYDPGKDSNYVDDTPFALDFSTSRTVKLQFDYNITKGFVFPFDLYDSNPLDNGTLRADLKPLASGINVAGYSQLSRVIPSYVDELYLYSGSLFVPLLSYAKIENDIALFQMIDVEIKQTSGTRAGNAGGFWKAPISYYLKKKSDFYAEKKGNNYKYDLINPDEEHTIPSEILTAIASTFTEGKIVDEKYYKDATIKVQKGKDSQSGAEVFISMLHAGGSFNNSLSYFVYTGDKELENLQKSEVEALEVINIFQYADVHTNTVSTTKYGRLGLTPGKYVQLLYRNESGELVKEFPVGAQIGWILHPDAFRSSDFTVVDPMGRLFSVSYWNESNNKTNETDKTGVRTNNYNIFFSATAENGDVYNCFGFEDMPNTSSDGDCNDVIFHVLTNPMDAIIPPPNITQEDIEQTEEKYGILAFEDNWPEQGDYDLNDVVIKYSSDITYVQTVRKEDGIIVGSTDVTVKKIKDTFSFINNGAAYKNQFSYKIDLSPEVIKSIMITDENDNTTDYTQKIVKDGNGFIIDLAYNPLSFNERRVATYIVALELKEGAVLQDNFSTIAAPYNPFITPQNGKYLDVEIHLPMYRPTSRVNMDLFGAKDDRSDKINLWYVSGEKNKYPFAIHLNGVGDEFTITEERQRIDEVYPNFIKWVESDMKEYKKWYLE